MMPLSFINTGESGVIKRIGGSDDVKKFLNNLGFIPGSTITVVNRMNGNVIVSVRDARVAISHEMAKKIMI